MESILEATRLCERWMRACMAKITERDWKEYALS